MLPWEGIGACIGAHAAVPRSFVRHDSLADLAADSVGPGRPILTFCPACRHEAGSKSLTVWYRVEGHDGLVRERRCRCEAAPITTTAFTPVWTPLELPDEQVPEGPVEPPALAPVLAPVLVKTAKTALPPRDELAAVLGQLRRLSRPSRESAGWPDLTDDQIDRYRQMVGFLRAAGLPRDRIAARTRLTERLLAGWEGSIKSP